MKKGKTDPFEEYFLTKFKEMGIKIIPPKKKRIKNQSWKNFALALALYYHRAYNNSIDQDTRIFVQKKDKIKSKRIIAYLLSATSVYISIISYITIHGNTF